MAESCCTFKIFKGAQTLSTFTAVAPNVTCIKSTALQIKKLREHSGKILGDIVEDNKRNKVNTSEEVMGDEYDDEDSEEEADDGSCKPPELKKIKNSEP